MSTLTYAERNLAGDTVEADRTQHRGFWSRVLERIVAAQQRRAEREIAIYLANHGGSFTDDTEREIMRRLSGGGRRSV